MERNPHAVVSHISLPMLGGYIALALIFAVCAGLEMGSHVVYLEWKPLLVALGGLSFVLISAVAVHRCARHGPRSIGQVCFWSAVLLGVSIAVMYLTYFLVVPKDGALGAAIGAADKLLNIPPVIAAVWVASIGWYVHFQATAKAHRTNNAFNLLMHTRTSREFLIRAEAVQAYFPHGKDVSNVLPDQAPQADYVHLRTLQKKLTTLESKMWPRASDEELSKAKDDIGLVEALLALKYMLNFYEVMAVAIEKNDLDDSLLYDTLGTHVPSLYRRAEEIAMHEKTKGNASKLAFTALTPLVMRWEEMCKQELRRMEDGHGGGTNSGRRG